MSNELMFYLLLSAGATFIFFSILKKVMARLDAHGFEAFDEQYKSLKEEVEKSKKEPQIPVEIYQQFCDFLSEKLNSYDFRGKESLVREIELTRGQTSSERQLRANLFYVLENFEEKIKESYGEEEAVKLRDELGRKYNELFS